MESEMSCCERIKFAFSKLLMECFGTFIFTLLFMIGNSMDLLIGLWILTIFLWKISASQMNPAVTLAFMFRPDGDPKKIHFSLGILMMGAQVLGAYLGALYIIFINWSIYAMAPIIPGYAFFAIMQETFGTFLFVLFFKIATDERMNITNIAVLNCFTIACAYIAAREIVSGNPGSISTYGACLNPAVAIGITMTSLMRDPGTSLKWFWLYWLLPLAGSLCAVIFYRFIYLKTEIMVEKHGEPEEANIDDMVATSKGDGILDD